jgi:peptide/nickel transport system ATP-binding protein
MSELLSVRNLRTYYETDHGLLRAVDDVSFGVKRGEILGLVGESGCGKTTVALTIAQLLPPSAHIEGGQVLLEGEDLLKKSDDEMKSVRWGKISMIFQGALNSLNPVLPIREQISEAILAHDNSSKTEAEARVKQLLASVGLGSTRPSSYPHELSGGMKQRVMIAMALACNPKIVIADEPTTALDVVVQYQILDLMRGLKGKFSLSMILITHDLSVVAELCDKVAIMYAGKVAEYGDVYGIFENPKHPYTRALLGAVPTMKTREQLHGIPGVVPDLTGQVPACRFYNRCPYAQTICNDLEPPLEPVDSQHSVACHFWKKIIT